VWTRLLGLMLGATVYTFSIILAVFLVGIGIGSTGGSVLARDARNPKALLGWCQMLLVARWPGRPRARPVAPVLADRSIDCDEPVVHIPA
jgi:hypothetical protein